MRYRAVFPLVTKKLAGQAYGGKPFGFSTGGASVSSVCNFRTRRAVHTFTVWAGKLCMRAMQGAAVRLFCGQWLQGGFSPGKSSLFHGGNLPFAYWRWVPGFRPALLLARGSGLNRLRFIPVRLAPCSATLKGIKP